MTPNHMHFTTLQLRGFKRAHTHTHRTRKYTRGARYRAKGVECITHENRPQLWPKNCPFFRARKPPYSPWPCNYKARQQGEKGKARRACVSFRPGLVMLSSITARRTHLVIFGRARETLCCEKSKFVSVYTEWGVEKNNARKVRKKKLRRSMMTKMTNYTYGWLI